MRHSDEPAKGSFRSAEDEVNYRRLLAQLRQDQLEAALAGRMAESAFFAAEVQSLREEFTQGEAVCA